MPGKKFCAILNRRLSRNRLIPAQEHRHSMNLILSSRLGLASGVSSG